MRPGLLVGSPASDVRVYEASGQHISAIDCPRANPVYALASGWRPVEELKPGVHGMTASATNGRGSPQQRTVVHASFDPSPQPMGRHRCERRQGDILGAFVGMTLAIPQPCIGVHAGTEAGHRMRKLDSLRQLRDRMGSNTHELGSAQEPVGDEASDVADNGNSPLAGAFDAGVAGAERLKTESRKLAGTAASVIRDASSKATDITATTGDRVSNRSRKVANTAASVGRDASGKAADVTAATTQRVRASSRSALDASALVAGQLMTATQSLLASNLSQDLNNLLEGIVKGSSTIYDECHGRQLRSTRC